MAIATALVVTFILIMRALFAQHYAYRSLRDLLQRQQETLVELIAEQLDKKFEDRARALERLARQLAPSLDKPPAELKRLAIEQADMPGTFNAVFVARPDGEMIFSTAVPDGVRMQLNDRDYFREVARGASVAVSDLLEGKLSRAPGVIVAVPMRGADGALRAVVGGVLNLSADNFLSEFSHARVGVTGHFCLVSAGANPRFALHPDPDKILAPARAIGETCGSEEPAWFLEPLMPRRPVVARYLLATNGWEVVAVLPASEAYALLREVSDRAVVVGLISLAVTAMLMWLVIRRLLAPLERLHRGVRKLAANPRAASAVAAMAELPTDRDGEIGELAGSFTDVLRQLSEREAALKAARDRAGASEKRFEAIANHVPDFVSFLDAGERFIFVNDAYARHFALPAQQIVGLSLRELWGTPEYVAVKPYLERVLAGGRVTFTRERPDGECIEITCQPAWDQAQRDVQGTHMFLRNVTGEREKLRSLEAQTLSDHLTGLLNRKGFDRRLGEIMARPGAGGQEAALLLVDLDDFKAVNDSYGHAAGDRLLVAFAERLSACVRKGDAVARIGGDEFAVVLENAGEPAIVERVAQTIVEATLRPFLIDGRTLLATASVGSAIHHADDGMTVSELFMRADMALYEAKRRGKARYVPPALATTNAG